MRDGVPLPGKTPAVVLSQLAYRVFNPLRRDRVRMMLDFHGLAGRPADHATLIAVRSRVHVGTVANRAKELAAAGSRLPLSGLLIVEISRPSLFGEDHLGRTRIAKTFGLTPPTRPAVSPGPTRAGTTQTNRRAAGIALRVLAAAGPQRLDSLQAAIARDRRGLPKPPPTDADLAAALRVLGAEPGDAGRWHAPPDRPARPRDRALVLAVAEHTLTRSAMIAALITAGYPWTYAEQGAINHHPLIHRIGPNSYRIVADER